MEVATLPDGVAISLGKVTTIGGSSKRAGRARRCEGRTSKRPADSRLAEMALSAWDVEEAEPGVPRGGI